MGRDGEQDLRSLPDSQGPQKAVETHPPTVEADRVLDAHRASEGRFVLFDLRSLHELCGPQQIAQGLSAIGPSSRPSEQSKTARQMRRGLAVHDAGSQINRPRPCATAIHKASHLAFL